MSSIMAGRVSAVDDLLRIAIPIAVTRFGSQDIEGVAHLPEVMRPPPEQKPTQLIPIESSEEVRAVMLKFVSALLERCSDDAVRLHGLKAIGAVMKCGPYKYNAAVVQMLMGWHDPNVVPIKAFYEPCSTHNYLARLVADRTPAVRMYFYETIVQWLHRYQDKGDYESWLFPYLLTGLFDENTSIQKLVYWLIEKCGELYEKEKEKDIRCVYGRGCEVRQMQDRGSLPFPIGGNLTSNRTSPSRPASDSALDAKFVREYETQTSSLTEIGRCSGLRELLGELDDVLAKPLTRPRLGSRCWVKVHFRRYAKGLFKEVLDFKEVKSESSCRLLVASLAYVEESITEWLDELVQFCSNLYARKAVLPNGLLPLYDDALKMAGAYVDPVSYWKLFEDVFDGSVAVLKSVCDKILEALLLRIDWLVESCGREERAELFAAALAVSGTVLQKQDRQEPSGQCLQETENSQSVFRILKTLVAGQAVPGVRDFEVVAAFEDAPKEAFLGMIHALVSLPPSSCNTASLRCLVAIAPPALTLHESVFTSLLGRLGHFRQRTHRQQTRRLALETAVHWIQRLLNSSEIGASSYDEPCLFEGVQQIASHIVLPLFCGSDGFCGTKGELDCLLPLVTSEEQTSSCAARKAYFLITSGIPEALADLVADETVHRSTYASALKALRLASISKYGEVRNDDWLSEVPVTTRRQTRLQAIQTSRQLKQKAVTLLYGAVVQVILGSTSSTFSREAADVLDCLKRVFTKTRHALVPVKELTRWSEMNDSHKDENPDKVPQDDESATANQIAFCDSATGVAKCLPLQPLDGGVAFYAVNLLGLVLRSVQLIASQSRNGDCACKHEEGGAEPGTEQEKKLLMSMPCLRDGQDSLQAEKLAKRHSSLFYSRGGFFPGARDKCSRQCLTEFIPQSEFHELIGHAVKIYVELGSKIHCEGLNDCPATPEDFLAHDELLPATSHEVLRKVIVELEGASEENKRFNAAAAISGLLIYLVSTFPGRCPSNQFPINN
ncbi:conserved hypothetical protein [Neospora caninum Liverpool]|uniref:Dynein axonemal assembly factor 5 TPR repeats domain-containing protein n=1 Tax=Neospora caninum (strain Liverpool) TaxID=572307 RepID=F0VEP0_NEOCL|nr:conserved hypothetical protein [Neospora caninum Liverpool]CBZ52184.1 conserved hypothetical protein [Neospora caninum Liverpool]|eukprot:XP_003882216.1 conserved hypothetical protein [Neospora caninum Liverpool]